MIMRRSTNSLTVNKEFMPADAYQFPKQYYMPSNVRSTRVIALSVSGPNGEPIYCQKCESVKPERTHHCKECNKCAPKMDQ